MSMPPNSDQRRSNAPTYVKFYKYEDVRKKLSMQGMRDILR